MDKPIGKVKQRLAELKEIKRRKDSGQILCIPFENYPKLAQSVPGVVPGMIQMVTAGSGVGKTQVTKALYDMMPKELKKIRPVDVKDQISKVLEDFIVINKKHMRSKATKGLLDIIRSRKMTGK